MDSTLTILIVRLPGPMDRYAHRRSPAVDVRKIWTYSSRSARRTRKSEARRTNDESSSKAQFAACGLGLVASRFSDRKPRVKTPREEGQGGKDK